MIARALSGILICGLWACSDKSYDAKPVGPTPTFEPISGAGGVNLNDEFGTVLSAVSPNKFNPASIAGCLKEMPLKGCHLFWDDFDAPLIIEEGIPFGLSVEFGKTGRAVSLEFEYRGAGDISRAQCADIALRTVDYVVEKHGPGLDRARAKDSPIPKTKTPKGRPVSMTSGTAGFVLGPYVSGPAVKAGAPGPSATVLAIFLPELTPAQCHVSFEYLKSPRKLAS